MNIKLTIAYDGGRYFGWQKTKMGPSIEEELEKVLTVILQHPIILQASSRTDAGVHASGQIVNFFTQKEQIKLDRLFISLNQLLPKDIVILNIEEAPLSFHPTLDCKAKEYHYSICASRVQLPQYRHYSWHIHNPLNFNAMDEAAQLLVGEHNFKSLCNIKKNSNYQDYFRKIHSIKIENLPDQRLVIKILGNNFLYKMVRNFAGILVYTGEGKFPPEEIKNILLIEDRRQPFMTAPAHGLSLVKIFF